MTPPGAPSFSSLRQGDHPEQRAAVLAALTDFRCLEHRPVGPPRGPDGLTSVDRARQAVDAWRAAHRCADPGCDDPAQGAISGPGLPTLGQLAQGEQPHRVAETLATAIPYCDVDLRARVGVKVNPLTADYDSDLVFLGGPFAMVTALTRARTLGQLAAHAAMPADRLAEAYRRIGVDAATVLAWRRGDGSTAPPPPGARLSPADRVERLGDLDTALGALAASISRKDLTRRLRGGEAAGTVKAIAAEFAALGVDLAAYYPPRLLHYGPGSLTR